MRIQALSSTLDQDRVPTGSCVIRSCFAVVNRLQIMKLDEIRDFDAFNLCVRLQGSKRSLRTDDIIFSLENDATEIDIDLQIDFAYQYPHFIKKQSNIIEVLLQRRKKYRNRQMPGFKTFASGLVNLSEVVQRIPPLKLELSNQKCVVAVLTFSTLCSMALNDDSHIKDDTFYSAGEEDSTNEDSDSPYDYPYEMSHMNRMANLHVRNPNRNRQRGDRTKLKEKIMQVVRRYRKGESLDPDLVMTNEVENSDRYQFEMMLDELQNLSDSGGEPDDSISIRSTPKPGLRPFFNSEASSREIIPQCDNLAFASEESKESEELDNTEDETLVPTTGTSGTTNWFGFSRRMGSGIFGSKEKDDTAYKPQQSNRSDEQSMVKDRSQSQVVNAQYYNNPASSSRTVSGSAGGGGSSRIASLSISEQIANNLPSDEMQVPKMVAFVSARDGPTQIFLSKMKELTDIACFVVNSFQETKSLFFNLVNRLQKFCNTNSVAPACIKIILLGSDRLCNEVLRVYTLLFAEKNLDWLSYVRFYIVNTSPGVSNSLSCFLAKIDPNYASLLWDLKWREAFENNHDLSNQECCELVQRLTNYLAGAQQTLNCPIAEVMLQCRMLTSTGDRDEPSQMFIPFILDVRVGASPIMSLGDSCDVTGTGSNSMTATVTASNNPPVALEQVSSPTTPREATLLIGTAGYSPPTSPHVSHTQSGNAEINDLNVEYFISSVGASQQAGGSAGAMNRPSEQSSTGGMAALRQESKFQVKTTFRSLVISKAQAESPNLTFQYVKDPKRKMFQKMGKMPGMKLKEKEPEHPVSVDNVTRLICKSSSQNTLMRVLIDGVEWPQTKYFQVVAQWPKHVKVFPIALFSVHPSVTHVVQTFDSSGNEC